MAKNRKAKAVDVDGKIMARKMTSALRNYRRRGNTISKADFKVIWDRRNGNE